MAMPIVENDVVELNVGGVKFSTSADTLGRDVDSMLAAMLRNSDRLDSKQIKKGRIFIDRDGERFRAVLNYLRNPAAFVKTQLETLSAARELLEEAEFFCLADLKNYATNEIARIEAEKEKELVRVARRRRASTTLRAV